MRLKDNKPLRRYQTYSISGTFAPRDGFTPSEVPVTEDGFRSSGLQGFPQINFPEEEEKSDKSKTSPDKGEAEAKPESASDSELEAEQKSAKPKKPWDVASVITGVIASAAKFSGWVVGQFMRGLHDAYPKEETTAEPGRAEGERPGSVGENLKQAQKKSENLKEGWDKTKQAPGKPKQECSTDTAKIQHRTSETGSEQCTAETAEIPSEEVPAENVIQAKPAEAVSGENSESQSGESKTATSTANQSKSQNDSDSEASPCQGNKDKDLEAVKAVLPGNAVLLDKCPLTVKDVGKKSILWRSFKSFTELKLSEKITLEDSTAQSEEEEALAREIMYALPLDLTGCSEDEKLTRRVVNKTLDLGRNMLPVLRRYQALTKAPGGITRHPLMEYLPFWLMAAYGIEKFPEAFSYRPDTGILVMESFGIASTRMRVHEREVIAARLAFLGNTYYFSTGKEPDFGVVLADKATASMLHLLTTEPENWNQPDLNNWVRLTNGGLGLSEIAQGVHTL